MGRRLSSGRCGQHQENKLAARGRRESLSRWRVGFGQEGSTTSQGEERRCWGHQVYRTAVGYGLPPYGLLSPRVAGDEVLAKRAAYGGERSEERVGCSEWDAVGGLWLGEGRRAWWKEGGQ